MLALDAALVSAHQPPFQQRSDDMDTRHRLVRRGGASVDNSDLMSVAGVFQPGIGAPSIGVNFSSWRHGVLYERKQAGGGNILDAPETDAAGAATVLCPLRPRRCFWCRFHAPARSFLDRQHKSHRPRQRLCGDPGLAGPSLGATYGAKSRPFRNCPTPAPAANPRRRRHSSDW